MTDYTKSSLKSREEEYVKNNTEHDLSEEGISVQIVYKKCYDSTCSCMKGSASKSDLHGPYTKVFKGSKEIDHIRPTPK